MVDGRCTVTVVMLASRTNMTIEGETGRLPGFHMIEVCCS